MWRLRKRTYSNYTIVIHPQSNGKPGFENTLKPLWGKQAHYHIDDTLPLKHVLLTIAIGNHRALIQTLDTGSSIDFCKKSLHFFFESVIAKFIFNCVDYSMSSICSLMFDFFNGINNLVTNIEEVNLSFWYRSQKNTKETCQPTLM